MYKTVTKQVDTYMYSGAIHIHTRLSDGTGDIYSISKKAHKAGLDWIIITDHNSFSCEEGIYNDVYVIKGEEITPENNSHYLALGITDCILPDDDPQKNIINVREQGGFGFAAHPDEGINRNNKWKPLIWSDKTIIPDGIEIWNWFSNWGDNMSDKNIFSLAYAYFKKHNLITSPPKETLQWWDDLNKNNDKVIPAIGGVDAHAIKLYRYIIPVTVFPYETCFKTITNIINLNEPLSQAFDKAKNQILTALKSGNNIIVNKKICDIIPDIYITNSDIKAYCGGSINLCDDTYINISGDKIYNIKIYCNSDEITNIKAKKCRIPINKTGKYRIELYLDGKGAIFTNPIKVIQE